MKKLSLALAFVLLAPSLLLGSPETRLLREGWRFAQGEQPAGVEQPDFDDGGWKQVRVPHDWAIAGPFDEAQNGYAAKLPWRGVGWYRNTFKLDANGQGSRVYLDFDGVMAFPKVYVNGQLAGEWDYGYTSFRIDATQHVRFGAENVVAILVDTRQWGTRWYPGAGIYRKVALQVENPIHIAHWGTRVTTNGDELQRVRPDSAVVETTIENHSAGARQVTVALELVDPAGSVVARADAATEVGAGKAATTSQKFVVREPKLWDVDHPHLYTVRTTLKSGSDVLDRSETRFGFRTFAFTADDGFHLNGRRVQLYGVNLHHDLGPLGGAFNRRAAQRQLEIMQEMGVNALRTSHNPPAPEVLDLCDEMGIVVWDEVFDKWDRTAGRHEGQPELREFSRRQIRSVVMRDRNHPSIVTWSTGNEISPGGEGITTERIQFMSDFVREFDTSRPISQGLHIPSMVAGGYFAPLDITGWNYARRYAAMRAKYPEKPIVYSESASALSTRGFYDLPLSRRKGDHSTDVHQVSSYDLNAADWSDIADHEFALMKRDAFVAGEFVWTGFDYLGEPTPFSREARSSYFGIVDLCGIPKDRYHLYRSHWRPDTKTIHILPHWNWPERVGQNVPVFVYTNGDSAELFLNGKSLGVRRKGEVPRKPQDFAKGAQVKASSEAGGRGAANAVDGDGGTSWLAAEPGVGQWIEVDLGQERPVRSIHIELEGAESAYAYDIKASRDGSAWETVASKAAGGWSAGTWVVHDTEATGRYLRVEFTNARREAPAGIRTLRIHPAPAESDYYDVTYDYRLRWNEVTYQPGELRVVAYKDGRKLGEATMKTAGEPAKLRLTPDRTALGADGEDLSFVIVEAVDADGNPAPLADHLVQFKIQGPAEIAGVGNGNPMSYEPFVADYRKLFYGKALLIVRPTGEGRIEVTATAKGLDRATSILESRNR